MLHDLLQKQCPDIHKKRLNSLTVATQALLDGDALSLTELGRNIQGSVAAKHNIKRIDRLLGNAHLRTDRLALYRWHARYLCGANPMPVVLVDWADVREQMRMMTLRASVALKGRSVILYERVFLFEDYNSPKSHRLFLKELAQVLPEKHCPIIVTDAGYRNTWFREVEALGWYFVGRLRGSVSYRHIGDKQWLSNKDLYPTATIKPRAIGWVEQARKKPMKASLYLYKGDPKGRADRRSSKAGRNHTAQAAYRAGSKEPWLLTTNLPDTQFTAKQIVNLYSKRMQIEESFRDLKSPQYGFGLRHNRSKCPRRVEVLLLIAMLAEMQIRLIGLAAQHIGWHRHFQANTVKDRAVLSLIRLGKEVRKRPHYRLTEQHLRWALNEFIRLAHKQGSIAEL